MLNFWRTISRTKNSILCIVNKSLKKSDTYENGCNKVENFKYFTSALFAVVWLSCEFKPNEKFFIFKKTVILLQWWWLIILFTVESDIGTDTKKRKSSKKIQLMFWELKMTWLFEAKSVMQQSHSMWHLTSP